MWAVGLTKPGGPGVFVDLSMAALKEKLVSMHWELVYPRSLLQTPDIAAQHEMLAEVAALVDRSVRTVDPDS